MRVISDDQIEAIHEASLDILENIGMEFANEEARAILKKAGVEVRPGCNLIRLDRHLVEETIRTAPHEFTIHARNPARNIQMGGNWLAFSQCASAPNCSDLDNGRRAGTQEDFRKLVKLGQVFNINHLNGGYLVEPQDVHASIRHLECSRDFVKLTDRAFHVYSLGRERNIDGMEICRIGRGVSKEQFERETSIISVVNTNSPLVLDGPMLQGIIEMSARNQAIIITPFTLAGAMAPVTLAGALAQQNAEALAGIMFTQLVRPGAPVVYGGFTSNVDMKTGAPAFGTPEYMKTAAAGGQLARRYKLPYRTSNVCAANTVDAQSAWESVFSLWGAVMGGGNYIKHASGWMEGGLCHSFEKAVIDFDLLQMVAGFLEPIEVNSETLALDAIAEAGPRGHFFGTAQTQALYRDAFYSPLISDWRNFENWTEAGSPTAFEKANKVWKQALKEYEAPYLDPAIAEELDDYVARRISEGGIATDF